MRVWVSGVQQTRCRRTEGEGGGGTWGGNPRNLASTAWFQLIPGLKQSSGPPRRYIRTHIGGRFCIISQSHRPPLTQYDNMNKEAALSEDA